MLSLNVFVLVYHSTHQQTRKVTAFSENSIWLILEVENLSPKVHFPMFGVLGEMRK